MKPLRNLLWAGVFLALVAAVLGGCAPVDKPAKSIHQIRSRLDLPQKPLENIGSGSMINSPNGNEAVVNYRDGDGRVYSYDPALEQVIEIDARARLAVIPTGAAALSPDQLSALANKYAAATVPGFEGLSASLRYEAGSKGDNYFYSWYADNPAGTMMPPFLQIALYKNGELFAYYNTLALK
jgi:hypothetical protein